MLLHLILALVPAILAITLHEAAHGFAAYALGDDTARRLGRLSLNPLRHIDPVGSIIVPGILVLGQLMTAGRVGFMFGWAKPVPVDVTRMRDPRRAMALVAAAGPGMNALQAWLAAVALHAVPYLPGSMAALMARGLIDFMVFNLVLGLFNLIPVPPLDGSRIVAALLPAPLAMRWIALDRYGLLPILTLAVLLPGLSRMLGYEIDPLQWLVDEAVQPVAAAVLNLAGHHAG